MADQRQRLHGLAESHVVGEDPAESVGPQENQPVEALLLVGPKLGVQAGRNESRVTVPMDSRPVTCSRQALA